MLRHMGLVLGLALLPHIGRAQDAPAAKTSPDKPKAKRVTPLLDLMATLPSSVKPELANVHPRVYFTDAELDALRAKVHGPERAEWQMVLGDIRALNVPPPPPPAEQRRAQNEVAMGIVEAAFAYKMEGDKKYLDAARRYMDAAVSYDVWGYSFDKPNTDLAAGHLLYGLGVGYDLLYHDLSEADRDRYRAKLARQGQAMYLYFKTKPGKTYTYSQNHTFIPMAGLGIAAYAVYGEVPEAAEWAKEARAIFERTLQTYSRDGYYYEGFEYWIFATPWILHYLDAQRHARSERTCSTVPDSARRICTRHILCFRAVSSASTLVTSSPGRSRALSKVRTTNEVIPEDAF